MKLDCFEKRKRLLLRLTFGLILFLIVLLSFPRLWCSRDAKRWYDGDSRLQEGLANGVKTWIKAPLSRENFTTGSPQFDGEWLFGTYMMAGMGYGQTALEHPEFQEKHLPLMERCIENLLSERVKAFDKETWGSDPIVSLDSNHHHAAFLGYLNLMLSLHRLIKPDSKYAELNDKISGTLFKRISQSHTRLIRSYPSEAYPVDNCAVVGSLALHARATGIDRKDFLKKWLEYFREHFVDEETGLLIQAVDPDNGDPADYPRGSGTILGLYFLAFADKEFSHQLYQSVKKYLAVSVIGFGGVQEYTTPWGGVGDIDSGPVVLGFGISPTGFLIAGSRIHQDEDYYRKLCASLYLFGAPVEKGDKFNFITGGSLGDAIMFAMLTAGPGTADLISPE